MKRTTDLILSVILVLLLFPVLLLLLILILAIDLHNPLFSQRRTGQFEKGFDLYKFRSMKKGKVTVLGKYLRSSSLDELPQLFNVLIGNMSLVGPRPLLPEYLPYYSEKQKTRFKVKPGITGLAQVNGRTSINWDKKLNYDIEYVNKQSFIFDMKILFITVFNIFQKTDTNSTEPSLIDYIKNKKQ